MYDIVFISYKEPNADEVYAKLKETYHGKKSTWGRRNPNAPVALG